VARTAGLALALVAAVAIALVSARSVPRTELVLHAAADASREAVEARASGVPSRVRGEGVSWSVLVRMGDVVSTERSLDWDGTLALYAPCDEAETAPETSAAVRAIVEAEPAGSTARLYEATSVETARARCVEIPALLHVLPRGAEPQVGDGAAAILVTLDDHDLAALTSLGAARPGAPVVVAIRRTILSALDLPIEATSGAMRLPIVGGDIAPLYADFFARGLRSPPLPPLTLVSSAPVSPVTEPAIFVALGLLLAVLAGLASRHVDRDGTPARAVGSIALGIIAGAVAGWLVDPVDPGPFAETLVANVERAAVDQGLALAAIAALLGRTPRRASAVVPSIGVGLGMALDRASSDFLLLAHDADVATSVLAALGRALLAALLGLALTAPRAQRFALVTGAWALAALAQGLCQS
jgi:hypothetical protein